MDVETNLTTSNKLDMSLDDLGKAMNKRKVNNKGRNFKRFGRRQGSFQSRSRRGFSRRNRRFDDKDDSFRRPRKEPKYIVRVNNLDHTVMKEQLMELFSSVGEVVKVWVDYDKTDRSKGTGGCIFKLTDDAKKAVSKFNGAMIGNKAVEMYGEVMSRDRRPYRPRGRFGNRGRFGRGSQRRNFRNDGW